MMCIQAHIHTQGLSWNSRFLPVKNRLVRTGMLERLARSMPRFVRRDVTYVLLIGRQPYELGEQVPYARYRCSDARR